MTQKGSKAKKKSYLSAKLTPFRLLWLREILFGLGALDLDPGWIGLQGGEQLLLDGGHPRPVKVDHHNVAKSIRQGDFVLDHYGELGGL